MRTENIYRLHRLEDLQNKIIGLAAESKEFRNRINNLKVKAWKARNKTKWKKIRENNFKVEKLQKTSEISLAQAKRIHEHRIGVIRPECRLANIAYGFIRGKKYSDIETLPLDPEKQKVREAVKPINVKRLLDMIQRFSDGKNGPHADLTIDQLKEWLGLEVK